jgi:hypothetical protein
MKNKIKLMNKDPKGERIFDILKMNIYLTSECLLSVMAEK